MVSVTPMFNPQMEHWGWKTKNKQFNYTVKKKKTHVTPIFTDSFLSMCRPVWNPHQKWTAGRTGYAIPCKCRPGCLNLLHRSPQGWFPSTTHGGVQHNSSVINSGQPECLQKDQVTLGECAVCIQINVQDCRTVSHAWTRKVSHHVGAGTGKGHEFWVELETSDRTSVLAIQNRHLHPTLCIPNMDLPILWAWWTQTH